jgi:hypothetical protein
MALDNLDITNQEEIRKDVTALIHIISKKLIITTPVCNTKTIEDWLDNLSQKLKHSQNTSLPHLQSTEPTSHNPWKPNKPQPQPTGNTIPVPQTP